MRYIIAAATAFALVAGIALGFVVSRGLEDSASAAPKTQAVEEQNVDANGFIAVHEQGTADVNVVSMPSQDLGPFEFTTLHARLCNSETSLCVKRLNPPNTDLFADLESLSAQGWSLIDITRSEQGFLIYTLSRPLP